MRILVTGATGYVGSRLVSALLAAGHTVRAASRRPASLERFDWHSDVETTAFDCLSPETLPPALQDVDVVYYLVHALGDGDFATTDRVAAQNLAAAAKDAGVGRLVYLGGFVPDGERLSAHLDSRTEVGDILVGSGIPTVWLKAAVIVGAGSTSFEIIRYVADRLLVIPAPSWMQTLVQPIAIDDALHYLVAAGDLAPGEYDIAGEERFPYRELIDRYLAVYGRRRVVLPIRFVSTGLAAGVLGRLTPVPTALAADLVESLDNTMVATEDRIRALVPDPPGGLTTMDEAIRRALTVSSQDRLAGVSATPDALTLTETDPDWAGGDIYTSTWTRRVRADPTAVWMTISGIGGAGGWSAWPAVWRVRGLVGRVTARRRDPGVLHVGDRLDFLIVEGVADGQWVRLRSSSRAPGSGRVELALAAVDGGTELTLRASWRPAGPIGQAGWWVLKPMTAIVWPDLLRAIANASAGNRSRPRSGLGLPDGQPPRN